MKKETYVDILEADHKRVKALFKKFENAQRSKAKQSIVRMILEELRVHAKAEETVVYPELRKVMEEDMMDEADIEHHVAKGLMQELSTMKPADDHYDAKVIVLGEIIDHHVEEEENDIFPKARKTDVEGITARLIAKKKELTAKA